MNDGYSRFARRYGIAQSMRNRDTRAIVVEIPREEHGGKVENATDGRSRNSARVALHRAQAARA